jgi:hypothetical protein
MPRLGRPQTPEPLSNEVAAMTSVIRVSVAWVLFGAIAAVVTYGPTLLRIVALGPISLAHAFAV